MPKYNVFESTNMGTTHYAARIFDAVCDVDVENGTFGYLDGLADGEAVIYNFKAGFKAGMPVVVVDNPAWDYDTCRITNQRRDQYVVPAGTAFRVRTVKLLDEFATAIEGVTAATREKMQTGAFVTIDGATGKLVAADAANTTGKVVMQGEVMRERVVGGTLSTVAYNYGYATKLYEVKVTTLDPNAAKA